MQQRILMLAAALILGTACNSNGGGTPNTPSPNPTPVPTTTITITSAGVNPKVITVPVGSRVTFVNNDSRSHEMHSDPHPNHGDCPPIDDVGFVAAGQNKQTGTFTVARTCGYHDHNMPEATLLQGQIVVQ